MMKGKIFLFNFLFSFLLNIRSQQYILVAELVDGHTSFGSGGRKKSPPIQSLLIVMIILHEKCIYLMTV